MENLNFGEKKSIQNDQDIDKRDKFRKEER